MEDILYTISETAKLLKTSTNYVYALVKSGRLPMIKLGSVKILRSSLLTFLKNNEGLDLTDPYNVKSLSELRIEGKE